MKKIITLGFIIGLMGCTSIPEQPTTKEKEHLLKIYDRRIECEYGDIFEIDSKNFLMAGKYKPHENNKTVITEILLTQDGFYEFTTFGYWAMNTFKASKKTGKVTLEGFKISNGIKSEETQVFNMTTREITNLSNIKTKDFLKAMKNCTDNHNMVDVYKEELR
ncbi:hypothetical protein [Cetobacterium sp.]|uniref:hypothetical protein n=1 Tax=Cetobacterium sp. TaxID=2071632 RepID=UPI003F2EF8F9